MIKRSMLENSLQDRAGSQTVFHGASAPGGIKYADMMASKPIGLNRLVYTLSRQNLTRPVRA
jgi:hypothetical protein